MIRWSADGTVLAARPHGETSVIVDVFTREYGRVSGLVRGGRSNKRVADLQTGSVVSAMWSARLEAHLGSFTIEARRSRAAAILGSRMALDGASTIAGLLIRCLPERECHEPLFDRTEVLFDLLGRDDVFPLAYMQWEVALLRELGFSLDLERCARTGTREDLCYVSPRSGRAVNRDAAGEYADRLLPLPPVLKGEGPAEDDQIAVALLTTGYFLQNHVLPSFGGKGLPQARERFISRLHHPNGMAQSA